FQAFENVTKTWDGDRYRRNLAIILENLASQHHFLLTDKDTENVGHVYHAFWDAGANLSCSYQVPGAGATPTYAQLMVETDGQGQNWSYLATEENFRFV